MNDATIAAIMGALRSGLGARLIRRRVLTGLLQQADAEPPVVSGPPGPRIRHRLERMVSRLIPSGGGARYRQAVRRAAAEERARIGRELHDGIVQQLLVIDVELELLRLGPGGEPRAPGALRLVQERVRSASAGVRALIARPETPAVDPSQLPAVIADLVDRFGRETGLDAADQPRTHVVPLPSRVCGELTRIVQEALVNVQRHSGAGRMRVGSDASELTLPIRDHGRGFPPPRPAPASGVRPVTPGALGERVRTVGGTLRVAATIDGAHLVITVPRNGPWIPPAFES